MDMGGGGFRNLTKDIPHVPPPDQGYDRKPAWSSDADSIAFLGAHKAWANFTPNIYLTRAGQAGTLGVASDPSTGAYDRPVWYAKEALFFTSRNTASNGVFRYDPKSGQRTKVATIQIVGDAFDVDATDVYLGTANGIVALKWRTGASPRAVGPGINPDLP